MNVDFCKDSFEVYNISVRQKLVILGFSPKIFLILTSVTSETSWGQTMSFSDLTEVSNFSWKCQLSYEVMFVELEWKLEHPETAISQWVILDPPRILNWPKSPHQLGLTTTSKKLWLRCATKRELSRTTQKDGFYYLSAGTYDCSFEIVWVIMTSVVEYRFWVYKIRIIFA